MRLNSRSLIALILSLVVTISAMQTAGIVPESVSADNTLLFQLTRSATSTESISASGGVEVNLESGQVTIQLKQASPNSAYQAIFATSGSNMPLGNITTGNGGEGNLETTLSSGTYAGFFQILKLGLLQFASATASFTIRLAATVTETPNSNKTTSTVTTTYANTSTQTENASATGRIEFQVEPSTRTISQGDLARFNIHVLARGKANVLLTARGVPPHSVAIFTQDAGMADPEFHSDLIIVTSDDIPIGTYSVTVISLIDGLEFDAQVSLTVASSSTITTSQANTSTTVTVGMNLEVSLSSDQHQYQPNATVNLQGQVTDQAGSAVAGAIVSLQVDGPTGAEIYALNKQTDAAGVFKVNFQLPANAETGTYTVFTSAAESSYASATTHMTFVVGSSSTPSVVIRDVYSTDMSGNRSAVFSKGQTILVWVVVENSGVTFAGVIWVQIRDANGAPIWIEFQISPLETGQTVKVAFGFQVTSGMKAGLYTANALVSDKLISEGGTFFASANTQFAVTV